jgi:prepilin signal peptidase PulO-like enzyme (type II secretory pathway)
MQDLFIFLSFIFGSAIGSFLNVIILRLPKEQGLNGRSHCMFCKHQLSTIDLVPLFSFVMLGGKCRYCKQKISPRYFYIELITALLFAVTFLGNFSRLVGGVCN